MVVVVVPNVLKLVSVGAAGAGALRGRSNVRRSNTFLSGSNGQAFCFDKMFSLLLE